MDIKYSVENWNKQKNLQQTSLKNLCIKSSITHSCWSTKFPIFIFPYISVHWTVYHVDTNQTQLIDLSWQQYKHNPVSRDHFVYAPSQWNMLSHCNTIPHWLGTKTKWSLWVSYSLTSFLEVAPSPHTILLPPSVEANPAKLHWNIN